MSNIINQRVIFSDNGTLSDISVEVNDFRSQAQVLPVVAAQDYIYIGSLLPFNHKWIQTSVVNDQASAMSVDIWWSRGWVAAVDLFDLTKSSGVTLAQPGILRFTMNRLKGWDRELDSADVTGLTGTNINNYYWIRLSFSADLNAATALSYIGHKFSDDDDLYAYYPDLNNSVIQGRFEAGKTDWNEQHFMAAEIIIRDLRAKDIIFERDQILDYELFLEASVHKVAELIYWAFGSAYADHVTRARQLYTEAMNLKRFNLDINRDGQLTEAERFLSTRFMER